MRKTRVWKMIVPVVALAMLAGASGAFAQCGPRVDNFFLFVDQSGSMYMTYFANNSKKIAAVKKLITQMDRAIYELGYKGGIQLFAPFQEVQPLTVYKQGMLTSALTAIKDDQRIFGRQTPMKTGVLDLEQKAVLDKVAGPTTVIMFTDGNATKGEDPLGAVKQIAATYPRVMLHVISLAQPNLKSTKSIKMSASDREQEKKGAATCQQMAKLGRGIYADAADLLNNPAAMQTFVNQVFCAEETIILRGVQFDFDKSDIKLEYQPILDEAVNQLRKWVWDYRLVINGHTDSVGKPDYNQKLSERRAASVKDYFAGKGIPANKMTTVGHGQQEPIADNKTEDGRAINRRVELDLLQ